MSIRKEKLKRYRELGNQIDEYDPIIVEKCYNSLGDDYYVIHYNETNQQLYVFYDNPQYGGHGFILENYEELKELAKDDSIFKLYFDPDFKETRFLNLFPSHKKELKKRWKNLHERANAREYDEMYQEPFADKEGDFRLLWNSLKNAPLISKEKSERYKKLGTQIQEYNPNIVERWIHSMWGDEWLVIHRDESTGVLHGFWRNPYISSGEFRIENLKKLREEYEKGETIYLLNDESFQETRFLDYLPLHTDVLEERWQNIQNTGSPCKEGNYFDNYIKNQDTNMLIGHMRGYYSQKLMKEKVKNKIERSKKSKKKSSEKKLKHYKTKKELKDTSERLGIHTDVNDYDFDLC